MITQRFLMYFVTASALSFACVPEPPPAEGEATAPSAQGYVLHQGEAETLVGGNGEVTIIASPATNSPHFAMGTQQLRRRSFIAVHRHEYADEAFFVRDGSGVGIIGENRSTLGAGDALYIPRGVWHGFETESDDLNLVWFIAPPGLEEFFRETRVPPGTALPSLTPEQMEQIGLKHGIRNKSQ